MIRPRLIPCLLIRDGGLVKTVKFRKPRYVGDPFNAIRIFNDKEVDELILLDISASREGRSPDFDLVEECAGECFMPLAYGGGISTLEHAERLFQLGVEKVCLQSGALDDLGLIERIASRVGSQSVVVSVDVKSSWSGRYRLYSSRDGRVLDTDWLEFMHAAVNAGAGEVVVNSVDRDGTMAGADQRLIENAATGLPVPLIALGGIGSLDDVAVALRAGADAVSAGSLFVFHGPHRAVLVTYPSPDQVESLARGSQVKP